MKNLVILLFSAVLLFASCKNSHDNFSQTATVQKSDSDGWAAVQQPDTLQAQILEAQNFVADTSFVSPQSAIISAQEMAKTVDENTYKLSLQNDRINEKSKRLLQLEKKLDSSISELNQAISNHNYLLTKIRSKQNEAILAKGDPDLE